MSRKRYPRPFGDPGPEAPTAELGEILGRLESPDAETRAQAVRELCPCRGTTWNVAVFPKIIQLRDDLDPVVRAAVEHDLDENPDWHGRQEARRLEHRRTKREADAVREEIGAGPWTAEPPPHSLAWRMRPRPRVKRGR